MILVTENTQMCTYDVRFGYDPHLVELIKQVSGRQWHPEHNLWSIPHDRLGFLLNILKGTVYENRVHIQTHEALNQNEKIGTTSAIPEVDLSDVTMYVADGMQLFAHQVDFLKFAKYRQLNGKHSGFLLADEPGCGKTVQATNLALYNRDKHKAKHCLIIVCVNSAKYNWVEDIQKHTNGKEKPYILGSRLKRDKVTVRYDTGSAEKLQDLQTGWMYSKEKFGPLPYFLIVNIEALRHKEGKKYVITDEIVNWINKGLIHNIIIDEIHRNASPSSRQGQQLLDIKKKSTRPVEWIPMTGTPITSKPTDVFLPLKLVDGHGINSFYKWCDTFCIKGGFGSHEIIGYKNIPVLKQMLEPNMLRRLKRDILDLPPKLRHTEYVDNSPYQKKLYQSIEAGLLEERDELTQALNPMAKLLRLRQVNGSPELVDDTLQIDSHYLAKNAKLSRLLELIEDIVSNGEKVIVFSNWVEPLRTLYRFVSRKFKTCCYTGTMTQEARQQHKSTFINNPEYPVLIGTVGALGTSHTLTVANNIIFYDEPWNPADIEQCEDRCHRPGTTRSVNIYSLITLNTVDEVVHNILSKKEGISDYIVDNVLDLHNHPELIDLLLSSSSSSPSIER